MAFDLAAGQPALPPPPMMGGGMPGMGGAPSMMGGGMPDGMGGILASLASSVRPQSAGDKVKRALEMLQDARDEDPKQGKILSMAIHVLRNGPDGLENFVNEKRTP